MPPSGYSTEQADHLGAFLKSCASALEQEAAQFGDTLTTRLEKEILDISRHLDGQTSISADQTAVLKLTREFYRLTATLQPTTAGEFWGAVEKALQRLKTSVLAIHVEPESPSKISFTNGSIRAEARQSES